MEQTFLSKVVLPLALFAIMFGMGLSLVKDDFRRVLKVPKAFAIGVACQMVLLPIVGFAVIKLFAIDQPEIAVGLMVLTFCPGGTTSNMFSYLAKGDVALSISLTAVVSLITPFTIPLLTALAMDNLMAADKAISLPLPKTIGILLGITVLPVSLGMLLRGKKPAIAAKADKPVKIFSVVFLVAIIAAIVKQNWAVLPGYFAQVGLATLTLNVVTMALGYIVARGSKLSKKQQITISMEVGIQNGTTALMVTGTLLANKVMTIAPAIYSLIMFATGALFGWLINYGSAASDDAAEPAAAES